MPSTLLIDRIQAMLRHEVLIQEQSRAKQELCDRLNCFTSRELKLLPLIVAGLSNKAIARQLEISHRTVKIPRDRMLKKPAQPIS